MVYMSRMPVGGKGQSRPGKRTGEGPRRSSGSDGTDAPGLGLEIERESLFVRLVYNIMTL